MSESDMFYFTTEHIVFVSAWTNDHLDNIFWEKRASFINNSLQSRGGLAAAATAYQQVVVSARALGAPRAHLGPRPDVDRSLGLASY